jgi:hypothetical protein
MFSKYHDKLVSDDALASLSDIVRDLGRRGSSAQSVNAAKGASETLIQLVAKMEEGYSLVSTEMRPGTKKTGHIFDMLMTKGGKLEHFEIKNYNGSRLDKKTGEYRYDFGKNIASCLLSSAKAKVCDEIADIETGGQLFDDFVRIFEDPKNIDITWLFNGVRGGDIANIRKELLNKISNDPKVLLPHIEKSGNKKLLAEFQAAQMDVDEMDLFLDDTLKIIIDRVFQQGRDLADISQ